MVTLKKLKASTLMETMVATVLVVIIFMIASLILNNVFSSEMNNNTDAVENRIQELRYLYAHKKISLPYDESIKGWEIEMINSGEDAMIEFNVLNTVTQKHLTKQFYESE